MFVCSTYHVELTYACVYKITGSSGEESRKRQNWFCLGLFKNWVGVWREGGKEGEGEELNIFSWQDVYNGERGGKYGGWSGQV